MKFVKWYLKEYPPKELVIFVAVITTATLILSSPLILYAALAGLEYHLWGTKWIAYMGIVLYYGLIISCLLAFPIGWLLGVKEKYNIHKRWENGTQK